MILDSLDVQISGKSAYSHCPAASREIIDMFHLLLPKAGWTITNSYAASVIFYFPLGYPTVGIPIPPPASLTPVSCRGSFINLDGVSYSLYNPYTEVPLAGLDCTMVALDPSQSQGLTNLANAINGTGVWLAVVTATAPGFNMVVTAVLPGSAYNYRNADADGRWGVAPGYTDGGGYEFTSSNGSQFTSQFSFQLTAHGRIPAIEGDLYFDFTINGHTGTEYLIHSEAFIGPGISGYNLVANPYSFWLYEDGLDNAWPPGFRNASLAAFAPYIPVEQGYQMAYAVAVVGPHTFRTTLSFNYATTSLDSAPMTYTDGGGYPRILAVRSPGIPLLTPDNKPLITTAWLMMGQNRTSGAWVVGRLWDCVVENDVVASEVIGGLRYTMLGSQDGSFGKTASTLLMYMGAEVSPPPPPPPPPALPMPTHGTVNIFGTGITLISGDPFTAGMVGQSIVVDGVTYVVAAFIDGTHLTLDHPVEIATGVPYTFTPV